MININLNFGKCELHHISISQQMLHVFSVWNTDCLSVLENEFYTVYQF